MNQDLFSYDSYEDTDDMEYYFHNCVLKVRIGKYSAGTEVKGIVVNYCTGRMLFYNDESDVIDEFELILRVKEK